MSQHREILQLSSLCYQAEGHSHQDPLHSCKPFQEEICPDTVLTRVYGAHGARGDPSVEFWWDSLELEGAPDPP